MILRTGPWLYAIAMTAVLGLWACAPVDLGECTPERRRVARRVVYTADGLPAYEGQAMINRSCGGGAFCHSSGISPEARYGVAAEFDFDLVLASVSSDLMPDEVERLRANRDRLLSHLRGVLKSLDEGTMPPSEIGQEVLESSPAYFRVPVFETSGPPVPEITSPEGREVLASWLACSAPVVERTLPQTGRSSDEIVGDTVAALDLIPIEPIWSDIYSRIMARTCASSLCHGARGRAGNLDLSTAEIAYAALISRAAESDDCGEDTRVLVVPGDPNRSFLVQKMEGQGEGGEPLCGDVMPPRGELPSSMTDAVRIWVANGALRD